MTSSPARKHIVVNEMAKLLYHWTYLLPLPSLSMQPQASAHLSLKPLPTSASVSLLLSSLALLCFMSTLLVYVHPKNSH